MRTLTVEPAGMVTELRSPAITAAVPPPAPTPAPIAAPLPPPAMPPIIAPAPVAIPVRTVSFFYVLLASTL